MESEHLVHAESHAIIFSHVTIYLIKLLFICVFVAKQSFYYLFCRTGVRVTAVVIGVGGLGMRTLLHTRFKTRSAVGTETNGW